MSAIQATNRKDIHRLNFALFSIIIVLLCTSGVAADPIRIIGMELGSSDDFAVIDGMDLQILADEAVQVIGVNGGRGRDTIINTGRITVTASTTGEAAQLGTAESSRPTYLSRRSERHDKNRGMGRPNRNRPVETTGTGVIGIAGGDGNDRITNSGDLLVDSDFTVNINDITFELIDSGDVSRQAIASAKGISGDRGHDRITNDGQVTVNASATVDTFRVNVDLIGGATDIDASSLASSFAVGIDGGGGNDHIANTGTTTVIANAEANSDQINISLLNALQGESARAPLRAVATGIGIVGGKGHDIIVNSGTLEVTADAKADALDLEFSAVDLSSGETSTSSEATVVGIDGGDGDNRITNTGKLNVTANATTNADSVSISLIDLSLIPDLLGTAGDASTSSIADVTGIRGGADRDIITNDDDITTTAKAKTTTFDLSWSADGISNPADIGDFIDFFRQEPVIDASTTAEAVAVGINSGDGHDVVYNNGKVDAKANSEVSAASLSVGFPFPAIIPITLPGIDTTEVATAATSNATGIFGGDGDNAIHNEGTVLAEADAKANSLAVGVTIEPSIPDGGNGQDGDQGGGFSYSLEGNLVDVGAQTEADALGIETDKGHDTLINKGVVTAKATANSNATDVEVKLAQSDNTISVNLSLGNASTEGSATAVGITSGSGRDVIANEGDVLAETLADTNSTTVSVDLELLEDTRASIGAIITKANTEADAESIGVTAGSGDDVIHSSGSVTARANTNADAVGVIVDVSAQLSEDLGIIGEGAWASTDTIASVDAEGISGGEGADQIWNEGSVVADAKADAHSVGVSAAAAGTKKGASIGVALTQANSEAEANSTGISGGAQNDKIVNSGIVNSKAVSDVEAESVSVALTLTDKGVALTGTAADGSTQSNSSTQGIAGDDGLDHIRNEGTLDVYSEANATSVSVSVAAQGASKGVALGVALSRATSEAETNSIGISGGTDSDKVSSSGLVKSHAKSKVVAGSVALAGGGTGKGLTVEGAAADGSTRGTSMATGISGGYGQDVIQNEGEVDVLADVEATSVSVAVSANGTGTGVALGVALARATSEAEASSNGLRGGADSDTISSSGLVKSHSKTNVIAGSGALAAGGTGKGLTVEGAAADGSTRGTSMATGIGGDQGDDHIVNEDTVDVLADADATSVAVAVSANGTGTGVAFGIGLARATSEAEANSSGISGGLGSDIIYSSGLVRSHAMSDVFAGGIAVAGGFAGKGVALEGAAADGLSRGSAKAVGITGDGGNDLIYNESEIDVYSEANTTSVSVAASASGTGAGVAAGVAVVRATSEAESSSTGVDGGDENDMIWNSNLVTAHAKSNVDAVSVAAAVGVAGKGLAFEGTGSDAATIGLSNAIGINGGEGMDYIHNEDTVDAYAEALATSTSVSVSVSGAAAGVALGVALSRADTQANANSTGIKIGNSQQPGDCDDQYHRNGKGGHNCKNKKSFSAIQQVTNSGLIQSKASANAISTNVSVQLGITGAGLSAGVALADASTASAANASGMEGSLERDIINNEGNIDSISDADAETTAVSVSFKASLKGATLGAAITDATSKAVANSVGIAGYGGDDLINNQGSVTSKSEADSDATSVAVSAGIAFVPIDAAIADSTTVAEASAVGIDGGSGNDYIEGTGTILADADSGSAGISVSVAPIGVSLASANVSSYSTAVGIVGGEEHDVIHQKKTATLTALSNSEATGTVISATLLGAAGTLLDDAETTADAQSIGIAGGDGPDRIANMGTVNAEAISKATGTSVSVALAGAALADASTFATSRATGISSGDGKDFVLNQGTIFAGAEAAAEGTSVAAGLVGYFDGDANTTVESIATGIDLGNGNDKNLNEASLNINAKSEADLTSGSGTLAGVTKAESNIISSVLARGIVGGTGDDKIFNAGNIFVGPGEDTDGWMSKLTSDGFSLNLAGVSDAQSSLAAITRSTGIDGEAGHDQIWNHGELTIFATSYNFAKSTSIGIFGTSDGGGISGAITEAYGISGGQGDDFIKSFSKIDVTAEAKVDMEASSYVFGGVGATGGTLAAKTHAVGISGGFDSDYIQSEAAILISATSTLDSKGESKATFGTSAGEVTSGAMTTAMGIEGGHGDDIIKNLSTVDVSSISEVNATRSAYTFGGGSKTDAVLTGNAGSKGISGGGGSDLICNEGDMTVEAISTLYSSGGAEATIGIAKGIGVVVAKATATGIDGEDGDDHIFNKKAIKVNATADATAEYHADAGWLIGEGVTESNAKAEVEGHGIFAGKGDNAIINDGDLVITAKGTGYSWAWASGAHLSWDGPANSTSNSGVEVNAVGIFAENGDNLIINNKTVTVSTETTTSKDITTTERSWAEDPSSDPIDLPPHSGDALPTLPDESHPSGTIIYWTMDPKIGMEGYTAVYKVVDDGENGEKWVHVEGVIIENEIVKESYPTFAGANGNGVTGTGTAIATGTVIAEAYGIKVGDGNNWITNTQEISVTAGSESVTQVSADGDAFGDAIGTATSSASAKVFGIWAGNGNNWITNEGTIDVTAAPRSQGQSKVSGGDICVWFFGWWCGGGGDGIGSATASFDVLSVGIHSGGGDNQIINNGTLIVAAAPEAADFTTKVEGDSTPKFSTSVTSRAIGIQTEGLGNNSIFNNGVIDVKAYDLPISYSNGAEGQTSIEAIGIWTGDGDDHISNTGIITVDATGSSPVEVAIRSGAGDDTVLLGDQSSITGDIELGKGDDTLHLFGTPEVNGSILSGVGTNSLIFDGEGSFGNALPGFEIAIKQGSGIYSLPELSAMQRLEVNQGTLHIDSDYHMLADSTYQTYVDGNGDFGQLLAGGTVDLDGTLAVGKGRHAFLDGTTFDVVSAGEVSGEFAGEELPVQTPLLSFGLEQTNTSVTVEASVNSFMSAADRRNNVGHSVAGYLDRILPTATDDISVMLGSIQGLTSKSEINSAYASLSPDSYDNFTTSMLATVETHIGAAHDRMAAMRAKIGPRKRGGGAAFLPGGEPAFFNAADSDLAPTNATPGAWSLNFDDNSAWQGLRNGYQGFNYDTSGTTMGFDYTMGERSIMGASFASTYSDLDFDSGLADGNIDSFLTSTYGTHFFGSNTYVETVLSYGRSESESLRTIQIGSDQHSSFSTHDGDMFSAFVETGQAFSLGEWGSEVFGSLRYASLFEEGFRETGADEIDLIIDDRRSDSLVSELGWRVGRLFETGLGAFMPQLSIGWVHDFDVDNREITARFAGAPDTAFSVKGRDIDRDGLRLGGVLTFRNSDEFDVSTRLNAEIYENSSDLSGLIQFSIRF